VIGFIRNHRHHHCRRIFVNIIIIEVVAFVKQVRNIQADDVVGSEKY